MFKVFIAIIIALVLLIILFFYFSKFVIIPKIGLFRRGFLRDISNMIEPKLIDISTSTEDLLELANEIWRIQNRINKISTSLTESNHMALENSVIKLRRYLERNDLEILDYTDRPYNENISAVEVISVEKSKNTKIDMIKEIIEPGILIKGKLVRKCKVIVTKKL